MKALSRGAEAMGVRLGSNQLDQFRRYRQAILKWNIHTNLTAISDPEEVEKRLFLSSIAISTAIPSQLLQSGKILDVGTGAGIPGLPLKIAFPGIALALIDSRPKKTAFVEHVSDILGLEDTQVYTGRAETLARSTGLRESFDVVLARGVARLSVLAELTLGFCRIGGRVVASKGVKIDGEVAESLVAIKTMGGILAKVKDAPTEMSSESNKLVVIEKTRPTIDKYPRRVGIPAKRPL